MSKTKDYRDVAAIRELKKKLDGMVYYADAKQAQELRNWVIVQLENILRGRRQNKEK